MIVWGPNAIPEGSVCDDLVDIVDMFPTFCELGGALIPKQLSLDGFSIVAQFHGRPGKSHAYTYGASLKRAAVFDGRWRLKKTGDLIDARSLPEELPANEEDPEAAAARTRLQEIMKSLQTKKAEQGKD